MNFVKKNKLIRKIFFVLVCVVFINFVFFNFLVEHVYSAGATADTSAVLDAGAANANDTGIKKTVDLNNPISGSPGDIVEADFFANIIKLLLSFVGTFAFIAFIIGGVMWLTSGGEADKVKKGRDIFIYAFIGLVVVFTSYAVLTFIISTITGV